MLCLDTLPAPHERCLVISVGSAGDFGFEAALHRQLPHRSVHVHDGSNFGRGPIRNMPTFVNFFSEDFGAHTRRRYANVSQVDVLKVDCEGCEFEAVVPFIDRVPTQSLLVKIHGGPHRRDDVQRLMTRLNRTHGIYYREPNIEHSDGTCIEFALRLRK
jgi:hypothetical protein